MQADCSTISYAETGAFSNLVTDYVAQAPGLESFYVHPVSKAGIEQAMAARRQYATPRQLLHSVLQKQYAHTPLHGRQQAHIDALLRENCFTVVTAHQPNLFTGPLYFVYKILHAIRLADALCEAYPESHFVPVYYMGSEDADIDELNHFYTGTRRHTWHTQQTGAVGRMQPEGIAPIIDELSATFGYLPFGNALMAMLRGAYLQANNIQDATFTLVNNLFAHFGLLVLIPDDAALKAVFAPVIRRELTTQYSAGVVAHTINRMSKLYKVQAAGRDINLFYLFDDGRRERIEKSGDTYRVLFSDLRFTEAEILQEVDNHPERFSPNVILRGLFQEMILPNIAFIGGGGELAYWLELKDLFEVSGVPYPVQVLRNSFLLLDEKAAKLQQKLGLDNHELFLTQLQQEDLLVARQPDGRATLQAELEALRQWYHALAAKAGMYDATLQPHAAALGRRAEKGIEALEKKIQRVQRKKLQEKRIQLEKLREYIMPLNKLQERLENMIPYYAQYGPAWLQTLYHASLTLEQQFTILQLPQTETNHQAG